MLIKTRGIVFRTVKHGETSLIADIFTEEKGLQTYLLGNVRSKSPRFSASATQPPALVHLVAYFRESKDIQHVKELHTAYIYTDLIFDFKKGAVALFMVELARKTIRETEENQALFHFLWDAFVFLDTTKTSFANVHLLFAVQLTSFLGFMPVPAENMPIFFDLKEGVFCIKPPLHSFYMREDIAFYFNKLLTASLQESHEISMERRLRYELLEKIVQYYHFHIEKLQELQSHRILRDVMNEL
jgi:DNA repair protein RecO (recombination protein O)